MIITFLLQSVNSGMSFIVAIYINYTCMKFYKSSMLHKILIKQLSITLNYQVVT